MGDGGIGGTPLSIPITTPTTWHNWKPHRTVAFLFESLKKMVLLLRFDFFLGGGGWGNPSPAATSPRKGRAYQVAGRTPVPSESTVPVI